jgi:periplasmic protein TonB
MRAVVLLFLAVFLSLPHSAEAQNPSAPAPPEQDATSKHHELTAARLINRVNPEYPKKARKQHVEGTVRLHAVISKDGSIKNLEVISGDPLLVDAALKAVRQWRYSPTLLDGRPKEVSTTIDVVFALNKNP